ncbi:MAG: hypothetical protein J2P31_20640, partial [Blastocatellia bacterium]|nr:hypothetical protein [Blastocatellia bacterium]
MKKSAIRTMKGDLLVDERLVALQQILKSKTFSGCETSQHILRFIVEKSIAERIDEIKEYTIATEVLGRPKEFNSKDDNIVRVQVHRLRKKIDEYYKGEGARDPIQIFIPRGHYYPQYLKPQFDPQPLSPQPAQEAASSGPSSEAAATAAIPIPNHSRSRYARIFSWKRLALVLFVSHFLLITYHFTSSGREIPAAASPSLARSLEPLWQPFIANGKQPLIVY